MNNTPAWISVHARMAQWQLVHPIVTISPPNCDSMPPWSIVTGSKQRGDVRGVDKADLDVIYLRTKIWHVLYQWTPFANSLRVTARGGKEILEDYVVTWVLQPLQVLLAERSCTHILSHPSPESDWSTTVHIQKILYCTNIYYQLFNLFLLGHKGYILCANL